MRHIRIDGACSYKSSRENGASFNLPGYILVVVSCLWTLHHLLIQIAMSHSYGVCPQQGRDTIFNCIFLLWSLAYSDAFCCLFTRNQWTWTMRDEEKIMQLVMSKKLLSVLGPLFMISINNHERYIH